MEVEYRKRIQVIFDRIDHAFKDIDPDLAECDQSQGALTLVFADQSRCILSAQPSVKQLWLALASKGTAYHFNYDAAKNEWVDDKGRGIEVIRFLESYLKEVTGLSIQL